MGIDTSAFLQLSIDNLDYSRVKYKVIDWKVEMLIVVNKLFVKEDKRAEFEEFINDRLEFIRDSDCLSYSFERPTDIEMGPSDYYVLRSVWNDMDHLRSWMASDLFQKAHEKFEGSREFYFKDNEMFFHEGIEIKTASSSLS